MRQHVPERDVGEDGLPVTREESLLDVVGEDLEVDVEGVHTLGAENALVRELHDEQRGHRLADAGGMKAMIRRHRFAGVRARDADRMLVDEGLRGHLDPGHGALGTGRQLTFEQRVELVLDAGGGLLELDGLPFAFHVLIFATGTARRILSDSTRQPPRRATHRADPGRR